MARPDRARGKLLLIAALGGATLIAVVASSSPAIAGSIVSFAKQAGNANTVSGIPASRRPRAGMLLPLNASGHFPSAIVPAGATGAKGDQGAQGAPGSNGATGPPEQTDLQEQRATRATRARRVQQVPPVRVEPRATPATPARRAQQAQRARPAQPVPRGPG